MSEEMTPLRKNPKKVLGRGLGSLLGEANTLSEPSDFKRVETVLPQLTPSGTPAPKAQQATTIPASKPMISQEISKTSSSIQRAVEAEVATTVAAQAKPTAPVVQASPVVPPGDRVWKVSIEKVVPNKEQPRKNFETEKLQELANSIKEKGILLPILVRPLAADTFEIIAGERRWRAAQLAGLQEVPVLVKKTENREALELALIENIQRQDINPIEEAEAYGLLSTRYGLTQQQIAERVSKDRSTVANLMRLMGLSIEAKALMKAGSLQLGQAKVLLAVTDLSQQALLAKKVVKQNLSVRATERLVIKLKESPTEALDLEDNADQKREAESLKQELQKLLGTKVDLDFSGKRSKVSIHFYSTPELNQFVDRLRKR
jgi:ParB family chromosome partitioning protein